jgi:hypothetical protein
LAPARFTPERFAPSTTSKLLWQRSWLLKPSFSGVLAYHFLYWSYHVGEKAKSLLFVHHADAERVQTRSGYQILSLEQFS